MAIHPALPAELATDLITGRRSIRSFAPTPVEPALLEDLLRTALWAPSPHNVQPWRLTVLRSPAEKARLGRTMAEQLARELRADGLADETIRCQTERSQGRITAAPVVILCSLVRDGLVEYPDARRNELEFQMAVQSVGALLQTIFLLAHARGLGSCWMAAPMYCPEQVRTSLGLPADYHPQALCLLGYPAAPGKVRPRRPFEEVVDLR